MDSLSKFIRHYVLLEWKTISAAQGVSLAVASLNILSLGLFAALPLLLINRFGGGEGKAMLGGKAGGGGGQIIDVGSILAWIRETTGSIADTHGVISAVIFVTSCYMVAVVATRAFQYASDRMVLISRDRITRKLVKDTFHHVSNLSMDFFYRRQTGDLVARINGDAMMLATMAFDAISASVVALPLFIIYWLLLFSISWKLSLAIVVVFGLKTYVANNYSQRIRHLIGTMAETRGKASHKIVEALSNVLIVKAFGSERFEGNAFNSLVDDQSDYMVRRRIYEIKEKTVQAILHSVATVTVISLGATLLLRGAIELPPLILFFFTANRSQEPIRELLKFIVDMNKARGIAGRVTAIFKERSSVIDGDREVPGFERKLEFKGVSFAYRPNEACIEGVDFSLNKGEVVAIVGRSGAGKSTLVNLLLRFHDPTAGRVLLDGVDLREFTQTSHRRLFGVVTQEPSLFNTTVFNNIAYGVAAADVNEEDVLRAARIAHVDEFAEGLDDAYHTVIGDRGVMLSGGQKQRVTLARAILRDPPILILDEATSSLDSHSEHLIQDAIDRFLTGRTALIVAHRLSTIRKADRILVMDKGRIVEEGTHDELMAMGGYFKALYNMQFATKSRQESTSETGQEEWQATATNRP
jgi:ATP-binding cassette, subfamily B, bacterial MsbA